MDGPHRSGPAPTEPVDDSPAWRPSPGYIVLALLIAAGGLGYGLMAFTPPPAPAAMQAGVAVASSSPALDVPVHSMANSPAPPAPASAVAITTSPAPAEPQRIPRIRDPNGDQTPDIADFVNPGEKPTMAEVIERLHQAGVYSGLGAFSPPGTRPPLIGLGVPEDFVLPEGYVRHYQATDDGQPIEPILMFSPDYQFFDAAGQPIALPADRVVPPELAPPGLPIRRIVIPAPAEPGRPGR
jgi:hypothetical protein